MSMGISCSARKLGDAQNTKRTGACQRDTETNLKELTTARAGTI